MLLINNLSFSRNNNNIIKDFNLSLKNGELAQLKGENGSGKTTLIKLILNILEPNDGEIFWEGKNVNKNIFNFYKETTFIMDKNTSTSYLTVLDNINFWRGLSSSKLMDNDILLLLETFDILRYKNTQVRYLSSGEIKKLELLRLILEQKKFWILDEPYNHLDHKSIEILNQTLIDHSNNDGSVLFASHFQPNIVNLKIIDFLK